MFAKIAATLSLAALAAAFPTGRDTNTTEARLMPIADRYVFYQGNGSPSAGWPSQASWGTWSELWNANLPLMRQSCGWNGWGINNSEREINDINTAIQQLSAQTGVDNRFILAIIMQETGGCTRAPTTNNGVVNPGLMQSHNGGGSCAWVNDCPWSEIREMVSDGTAGTAYGDGLRQTYSRAAGALGDWGSRAYYSAARLYNSGSVDYNDMNNGFTSTRCYAADVANRLTGWTLAARGCW
ncbi:hypothetical protein S40285_10063 [Stachybotrys chlorohalonatus IBT 40285]|uniref:Transglycosylase SLT domain-containing protein n=1 Tax=Stachybotrys chlorohalonatus (strain IBT 40285) TaxID=1283841 RepID=A0A084QMC0_STAC4|nr:hypothetical protein S40285_10063 [Stachybotrys chlorohalonata IBT 40285]